MRLIEDFRQTGRYFATPLLSRTPGIGTEDASDLDEER
jgi:hypothetical protein